MNWSQWLEIRENNEDLNKLQRKLKKTNKEAGRQSGMPGFENTNTKRKDILKQIEKQRPLTRSEYINLYGYEAWLEKNK